MEWYIYMAIKLVLLEAWKSDRAICIDIDMEWLYK